MFCCLPGTGFYNFLDNIMSEESETTAAAEELETAAAEELETTAAAEELEENLKQVPDEAEGQSPECGDSESGD